MKNYSFLAFLAFGLLVSTQEAQSTEATIARVLTCREALGRDIQPASTAASDQSFPALTPNFMFRNAWPTEGFTTPYPAGVLLMRLAPTAATFLLAEKQGGVFVYQQIRPFPTNECPTVTPAGQAPLYKMVRYHTAIGNPAATAVFWCRKIAGINEFGLCANESEEACSMHANRMRGSPRVVPSDRRSTQAIRASRITEAQFVDEFKRQADQRLQEMKLTWDFDDLYRQVRRATKPEAVQTIMTGLDRIREACTGMINTRSLEVMDSIAREMNTSRSASGGEPPAATPSEGVRAE